MNNTSYTLHSRRPARLTTKPVSGTFTRRYGNAVDPDYEPVDYDNTSGSSSGGWNGWNFLNNITGGFFGWQSDKNLTNRNNNDNATEWQLSDDKTKRTRTIILGLVAIVLVVGAVLVMTKKK